LGRYQQKGSGFIGGFWEDIGEKGVGLSAVFGKISAEYELLSAVFLIISAVFIHLSAFLKIGT
jgi:hypothetical protein